jgi:hypothetical protein
MRSEVERLELFKKNMINLSGENAHYIYGLGNFDPVSYFDTLDNIEVYNKTCTKSKMISFTNKFMQGTLTKDNIELIINQFNEEAEEESDIYYFNIDVEDNLPHRIDETRAKLKKYLECAHEDYHDNKYKIIATNEDIEQELSKYYYIKIGKYYLYGVNIELLFHKCQRIDVETFETLQMWDKRET